MFFSLSPIISLLIEDNVIRQWGLAHHTASAACSMERPVLLESRRGVCVSLWILEHTRAWLIGTKKVDN